MTNQASWGKLERESVICENALRRHANHHAKKADTEGAEAARLTAQADNLKAAREDVPPYLTMDERLLIGRALRDYATHGPGETSEETCELLAQRVEVPIKEDHVQALGRGVRPETGPLRVADDWLTAIRKVEGQ